MKETATLETCA